MPSAALAPVEVSTLPGREETIEFRLPAELVSGLTPNARAVNLIERQAWRFHFSRKCASAPICSSRS